MWVQAFARAAWAESALKELQKQWDDWAKAQGHGATELLQAARAAAGRAESERAMAEARLEELLRFRFFTSRLDVGFAERTLKNFHSGCDGGHMSFSL